MVSLSIRASRATGIFEGASELDWETNAPPFQPIVQGMAGFGSSTAAGSGRDDVVAGVGAAVTVWFITNLNLSGAGSWKQFMQATGRRIGIPMVSGLVDYEGQLETTSGGNGRNIIITDGNMIFAGQGAPSPGFFVKGAHLVVNTDTAHDILLWHLGIMQAEYTSPSAIENNGDCFGITGANTGTFNADIILANCALTGSSDEIADNFYGVNNITYWQCLLGEPYHDNNHPNGPHGFGPLLTNNRNNCRAAFIRCLFINNFARNPATAANQLAYLNNVVYNPGDRCVQLEGRAGDEGTSTNIEGNVFIKGPSTTSTAETPIHRSPSGGSAYLSTSTYYLSGNRAVDWNESTQAALISSGVGTAASSRIDAAYPAGYAVTPVLNIEEFVRLLLRDVGCRPAERLPHYQRLIDQVEAKLTGGVSNLWDDLEGDWASQEEWSPAVAGLGSIINGPEDFGGYPVVAANTADFLTGPDPIPGLSSQAAGGLPLGVAGRTIQASGYTALEEWLWRKHLGVMSA